MKAAKTLAQIAAGLLGLVAAVGSLGAEKSTIDVSKLPAPSQRMVDFAKEIAPILAKSCHACHGPEHQEAGLRLDVKRKALAGGDSGRVIVPGHSDQSRLVHLIAGLDEDAGRMPPESDGEALSRDQIATIRKWIDTGADWPEELAGKGIESTAAKHWSFQAISQPIVPVPKNATWMRNPIDAFILTKLERESVDPSPEADRVTLLRRVYLDLIGLPPTPEVIEKFLSDTQVDAYERVVNQLLESPHYGERWGRYWLDAARYADSDGFAQDKPRPFAWRYRDWVIDAINRDLPFDVFTVQQLAGDLLSSSDREYDVAARIATGFHRNTLLNREGGVDPEEDRVKRTIDRANTTGTVWLGLTVGCANCHSHKYDPISQREYFGLYAFFNNLNEVDLSISPEDMFAAKLDVTPKEAFQRAVNSSDDVAAVSIDKKISSTGDSKRPNSTQDLTKPTESPKPAESQSPMKDSDADKARRLFQAVAEEREQRETFVHLRGDFLSPGAKVAPHTPEVLPSLQSRGNRPDRLDLARWITSPNNPLTARVIVNRVWQFHFGRGLVSTSEDFGTQGEMPSHPEMLNWLASEFRNTGWRMKQLHRLIVTSATYRQSSHARPELTDRDPYNTWLARQNRLRVEAEIVRDMSLSVSGLLNPRVGGPSVRPPQPAGVAEISWDNENVWIESTGADRFRRGLYTWFQRTSPYPMLLTFDGPDSNLTCTRRERSNTPLQALTLLNDVVFVECAQSLARESCGRARK